MGWLTTFTSNQTSPATKLITAVLWIAAIFFMVKPIFNAFKAVGSKKWGDAGSNIGGAVAIFAIAVMGTVGLLSAGKKTGNDLNQQLQSIFGAMPVIAIYTANKFRLLKNKLN